MDIVEERAAGAGAGERGTRGVGREGRPLKTVTLDVRKYIKLMFPIPHRRRMEPLSSTTYRRYNRLFHGIRGKSCAAPRVVPTIWGEFLFCT